MPLDPGLDELLIKHSQHKLTQKQLLDLLCQQSTYENLSLCSLQRHLQRLKLSTAQPSLSQADKDQCATLMKEYHTKRWQQKEVVQVIQNRHKFPLFTMTMLKSLSKQIGLHWRKDDIELGLITAEEAARKMIERKQAGDENAGSRRMAHIMATAESVRPNQNTVAKLLSAMLDKYYPDRDELSVVTAEPLSTLFNNLISQLGWNVDTLNINSVWDLLEAMHQILKEQDLNLDDLKSANNSQNHKYEDEDNEEIEEIEDEEDEELETLLKSEYKFIDKSDDDGVE
ncbi:uncharacterized protein MELLADRAFT_107416 [Melampsora larici-populina 98AG31]|uniref:Uncharacterized protein n=1 Tax=Melampsora larici-populina (strain 98AG31 / pathotype 3-4-7) TaxID=747676 RepID=F4RPQ5_MELLP|nr:uncharacterized protein MELLADRAFT_107416 [Melampsora larici-populina 98AG31]EGG05691.1 hypothetical protein MELLADRAFT_107416 [Melampsora larici-populina 98AG31]